MPPAEVSPSRKSGKRVSISVSAERSEVKSEMAEQSELGELPGVGTRPAALSAHTVTPKGQVGSLIKRFTAHDLSGAADDSD